MKIRHVPTDPICLKHRPARSRLARWWFDRHRGRGCPICTVTYDPQASR